MVAIDRRDIGPSVTTLRKYLIIFGGVVLAVQFRCSEPEAITLCVLARSDPKSLSSSSLSFSVVNWLLRPDVPSILSHSSSSFSRT